MQYTHVQRSGSLVQHYKSFYCVEYPFLGGPPKRVIVHTRSTFLVQLRAGSLNLKLTWTVDSVSRITVKPSPG